MRIDFACCRHLLLVFHGGHVCHDIGEYRVACAVDAAFTVNAGVGLLVLFRLNRDWKQNAGIVAALYGLGVFWGVIIRVCGIVF